MAKKTDTFHPSEEAVPEISSEEQVPINFGSEETPQFELPGNNESFELDLSDPNVTGVVPEGVYPAYLSDLQKDTSQKGDPMWVWYFTPLVSFSTNTLRLYTVLTPNAAWKVMETLKALGLGNPGEKAKFTKEDALNRLCSLEIIHEEYRGQMRASVRAVLPHPDGVGAKFKPFSGVPEYHPPDGQSPF